MLFSKFLKKRTKVFDENIEYFEDKINSNAMVKKLGCPVPKIYSILDNIEDISKVELPKNCVIKFNNLANGGGIVFRRNGKFDKYNDIDQVINFLKKNKHQRRGCQESVKKIKQKIIIEELLSDSTGSEFLVDIKLFSFYGKCHYIYMQTKFMDAPKRYYDINFNRVKLRKSDDSIKNYHKKPLHFDEIIACSNKIAERYFSNTFVRLDFYSTKKGPVFGEFTFNPSGGHNFTEKGDKLLGVLLDVG